MGYLAWLPRWRHAQCFLYKGWHRRNHYCAYFTERCSSTRYLDQLERRTSAERRLFSKAPDVYREHHSKLEITQSKTIAIEWEAVIGVCNLLSELYRYMQ